MYKDKQNNNDMHVQCTNTIVILPRNALYISKELIFADFLKENEKAPC